MISSNISLVNGFVLKSDATFIASALILSSGFSEVVSIITIARLV